MSWNRRIIASAAVLVVLAVSTEAEAGGRDRVVAGLQRQRIWTEYGWQWRAAPICY